MHDDPSQHELVITCFLPCHHERSLPRVASLESEPLLTELMPIQYPHLLPVLGFGARHHEYQQHMSTG